MKKIVALALFVLVAVGLGAQETCTKFDISGFIVELKPSKTFRYEYDKSNAVELRVKGDELQIKSKEYEEQSWFSKVANGKQQRRLTLVIYTPYVEKLKLENSDLNCSDALRVNNLNIEAKASQIRFESITAGDLKLKLESSSTLTLGGSAESLGVECTSNSNLTTVQFKVENNFALKLASSATANMKVRSETANILLTSSANLALDLITNTVNIKANTNSKATLTGTAKQLFAEANSAGKIEAEGLKAGEASVQTNSLGKVKLNSAQMVKKREEVSDNE